MFTVLWDVKRIAYWHHCWLQVVLWNNGNAKCGTLKNSSSHGGASPSSWQCLIAHPQVQKELQIFSVLVSLSWITHCILPIWLYWIFISILVIARSLPALEAMCAEIRRVGLVINPNKTKYMRFSAPPSRRSVKGATINGVTCEGVA